MKRDPNQFYSFGGQLYGPGKVDVAELDKTHPLKEQPLDKLSPLNNNATGTDSENNADPNDDSGLKPEEYEDADGPTLLAELRRRGLEAPASPKKPQLIKILEKHDQENVNRPQG